MTKKHSKTRKEYHENVIKTWSDNAYQHYESVVWRWAELPFRDYIIKGDFFVKEYLNHVLTQKVDNKSILEVGSAMGNAYKFMKKSNLIDLNNYTGIEVSKVGTDHCKKNYPETNWIHKDFTTIEKIDDIDYSFERDAIHHMPDPIEAYKKVLKATNIAFSTCFRSCLSGESISDLEISHFKSTTGTYYSSVINLFDLIELGLENGFGSMKITYGGKHEKVSNDPNDSHFIDSKINQDEIFLSRCKVHMIKTDFKKQPQFTFVSRPDNVLKNMKAVLLINKKLQKIKDKYKR